MGCVGAFIALLLAPYTREAVKMATCDGHTATPFMRSDNRQIKPDLSGQYSHAQNPTCFISQTIYTIKLRNLTHFRGPD